MKILLVHNLYHYRGGEETYFDSLAHLLLENKHTVTKYTKDSRIIPRSLWERCNIAVNLFWNPQLSNKLEAAIQKYSPDVAHIQNIYPLITPTVYFELKKNNIPIVQTIHNYRFFCPKGTLFRDGNICELCIRHPFPYPSILHGCYQSSRMASLVMSGSMYWNNKNIFDLIDHFIFPSSFTHKYYIQRIPTIKHKSSVLPYFVLDKKKAQSQKQYFLYIGRLSEEKGIKELLDIFSELKQIPIIIIGDGPLSSVLQKKYHKFQNIQFLGRKSSYEISNYIRSAKCLIISSKWFEVLPLVYLEALSCGKPVLAPDTDIFVRTIEKNKLFYYPFNNFNALKKQVVKIDSMVDFSSFKFYDEYKAHFTPEKHYRTLMKIYAHVTKNN
ncbi:MAG: glycosyltransferase [Candidatus Roizmanbacteria bacterium GW2011_GWA2_37_7]|uniref:Glycosyltransferase n=1 Tax=Candidatus Roizmanbacteria bacterium GW2011_GWA2_37_7 TaxID=1618481 RepID=A0A0G0H5I1_9BACT|nr:MAG: glycosyltransferase [Candidatus Roizmanbacteria bacterium GW2011_GWA2_37_7]